MSRQQCAVLPRPGLHPPRIGAHDDKLTGKRLLALMRLVERDETEDNKILQQLLTLLRELSAIYSIRGLLQGDVSKAEKILSTFGSNTAVGQNEKPKRKNKGVSSNQGGLKFIQDNLDGANEVSTTDLSSMDATLALSALVRAFSVPNGTITESSQQWTLIAFAANTCTSICERVKSLPFLDSCALAEYELMTTHGKPLLVGLSKVISSLLSATDEFNPSVVERQTPQSHALKSCLQSSASLVSLLGVRLSRNTAVLANLRFAGFRSLSWPDSRIQRAAASLIIATTLTGGPDKSSPSDLWNNLFSDGVSLMSKVLYAVLPTQQREKTMDSGQLPLSAESQQLLTSWENQCRQLPINGEERVQLILPILDGLNILMYALLAPLGGGRGTPFPYVDAKLSMPHVLDVLETMLSFPTTAESLYYGTKKRLRSELPQHGWLNVNTIVARVANQVKVLGCEMLQSVINSVGGPSLLTHGRRVLRIAYMMLFTAMSSALRKVIDPAGSGRLDGKRQKWLHASVRLRIVSIRAFTAVVAAFGPSSVSCIMQRQGSMRGRDIVRAISLMAGTFLEQVTRQNANAGEDVNNDWGSITEQGELACEATSALTACLNSCAAFIPFETRSLVDSVISTALSSMFNPRSVASWTMTKVAIFQLASCCLTTPWPDGAASSLVRPILQAADRCALDADLDVSTEAKKVLHIIQSQITPHAPPLLVITRNSEGPAKNSRFHDISLASGMMDEIEKANKAIAEAEHTEKASQEAGGTKLNAERDRKRAKLTDSNKADPIAQKGTTQTSLTTAGDVEFEVRSKATTEETNKPNKWASSESTNDSAAANDIDRFSSIVDDEANEENFDEKGATESSDMATMAKDINNAGNAAASDDEEEDDFPMIVDVDPDAEDV